MELQLVGIPKFCSSSKDRDDIREHLIVTDNRSNSASRCRQASRRKVKWLSNQMKCTKCRSFYPGAKCGDGRCGSCLYSFSKNGNCGTVAAFKYGEIGDR